MQGTLPKGMLGGVFSISIKAKDGKVIDFDLEGISIYDVSYSIQQKQLPAICVQLYAGSGKGGMTYWRQRITGATEELMEPLFIEAIGLAIEQAKDGC